VKLKLNDMAQQTAVSWLIDRLLDGSIRFEETEMGFLIAMKNGDEIEQAKAMEKKQIIESNINGQKNPHFSLESRISKAEQYYNETYKK
jgi:hypothetical protein